DRVCGGGRALPALCRRPGGVPTGGRRRPMGLRGVPGRADRPVTPRTRRAPRVGGRPVRSAPLRPRRGRPRSAVAGLATAHFRLVDPVTSAVMTTLVGVG